MSKVLYPEFEARVIPKFGVKDVLHFLQIEEGGEEEWLKKMSMVDAKSNRRNRPFKKTLGDRYANEILRGKWTLNGESTIISRTGQLISAQHRFYAILKAEKMRKANSKYYAETYGWRGQITIPIFLVTGVDDKVADSTDQGEPRKQGDVLFRMGLFDDYKYEGKPEFKLSDKKKLARYLATAIRTVWLRVGGKDVASAPKFPSSEMLEFLDKHPKIKDAILCVYREENGVDRSISSLVSPAYMAAVMYLGGTSTTDREEYDTQGASAIEYDLWADVENFVAVFGSGVGLEKGSPVLSLKQLFTKQLADGNRDRDVTLNLLIKSMLAFLDNKECPVSELKYKVGDVTPRLGGLDVEVDIEEEIEAEVEEAPKVAKKVVKAVAAKSVKPVKSAKKTPKADENQESDDEADEE